MVKIKKEIEEALEIIRPAVQMDGGDVQLVDVSDDGVVKVAMMGACQGCPMSTLTLKAGIETYLKRKFDNIQEVVIAD